MEEDVKRRSARRACERAAIGPKRHTCKEGVIEAMDDERSDLFGLAKALKRAERGEEFEIVGAPPLAQHRRIDEPRRDGEGADLSRAKFNGEGAGERFERGLTR